MIKVPELESFDFDFKNTYVAIYSMLGYDILCILHLQNAVTMFHQLH